MAKFRIVCWWDRVREIIVSLPKPVYGHQLLAAVKKREPSVWSLTQWRGNQMFTSIPAVDLGCGVYAGNRGQRVEGFIPLEHTIQSYDEMFIPGDAISLIYARR